jgi:ribosomal protein S12 methylthiotransferase accessory factor
MGGSLRYRPAEETFAAIAPHLASIGVTRIADITGLDRLGIPVFTAHRPNGRCLAVTQGKGPTEAAARVSAAMEALEQHLAERPILPLRYGEAASLTGTMVDLDRLPRISGTRIDRHRPSLWVEGTDMVSGGATWLPHELVHLDFRLPLPPNLGAFLPSSNGLASGNSRDEAVLHALCEVIERDAIALFEADAGATAARRVAPDSVTDAPARALLDLLAAAGVDCAIWDITSDLGVAAFYVTVIDRDPKDWRRLYPASGSGCHPDRGIALIRALTEAAQSRLTMISGARDDLGHAGYADVSQPGIAEHVRALLDAPTPRRMETTPHHPVSALDGAVTDLVARLLTCGLGAPVLVDLSVPEIPASVVRVVVPGLEGPSDAPGYAHGARALAVRDGDDAP